jgi:hypothetical protein
MPEVFGIFMVQKTGQILDSGQQRRSIFWTFSRQFLKRLSNNFRTLLFHIKKILLMKGLNHQNIFLIVHMKRFFILFKLGYYYTVIFRDYDA